MKKLTLLLYCLGLALASTYAQGVSFGIKAGLNFAKETVSISGVNANTDSKTAFHGGVYAKIMFSGKLGLQPELLYSAQGGQVSGASDDYTYLNVPVLLRYNVAPLFNLHVGPQLGLLMSAKSGGTDIKSSMKSTDWGIAFGGGVELPIKLSFTLRYIAGLSDLQATSTSGTKWTQSVIQLSVGYKLFGAEK